MDKIATGKVTKDEVVEISRKMLHESYDLMDEHKRELAEIIWEGMDQDRILGPCPKCREAGPQERAGRDQPAADHPREEVGQALRRLRGLPRLRPDLRPAAARRPDQARGGLLDLRRDAAGEGAERPPPVEPVPERGVPLDGGDARASAPSARPRRAAKEAAEARPQRGGSRPKAEKAAPKRRRSRQPPAQGAGRHLARSLIPAGGVHHLRGHRPLRQDDPGAAARRGARRRGRAGARAGRHAGRGADPRAREGPDVELSPIAETLLFGAARAELVETRDPAGARRGQDVICDRYVDSTVAYQGGARGLGIERVEELNEWITRRAVAGRDLPARRRRRRLAGARGGELDRFEREGEALQRAVAAAYEELAERHPDRYVRIDAHARAGGGPPRTCSREVAHGDASVTRRAPSTSRRRASRSRRRCATTAALSHAYLFHGPPGSGKRAAARAFAAALIAARLRRSRRRASGACCRACIPTSPGSSRAARTRSSSTTCATQVVRQAALRPFEAQRRVFVIADADRMNEESQNALLKTLEEPAAFAHFVLVSSAPGRLLQTIPSRCRPVRFGADAAGADRRAARGGGRRAPTRRSPARAWPAATSSARARLAGEGAAARARPRRAARATLRRARGRRSGCSPQPWRPLLERAAERGAAAEAAGEGGARRSGSRTSPSAAAQGSRGSSSCRRAARAAARTPPRST